MLHTTPSGEPCGLVSNIQKYTIHDGPGIRTEVFFTGCPLRCLWCSNPETMAPYRRIGVYPDKCISLQKCGYCVKACPLGESGPLRFDEDGILASASPSERCAGCARCTDECPSRALKLWGERMTVPELMKVIVEDRNFYRRTGGGVTLSGGEVMLQWEFADMLLRACRDASVNTCVESALHCAPEHMEAVYEHADLVIADIKHMDTNKHREYTGAGNELILDNLRRTARLGKKLVIRTPVVFGYNGDEENIRRTARFICDDLGGGIIQYQLLPYRKMGTEKYDSLGIPYPMSDYEPPERAEWEARLLRLRDMLALEYGLPAVAGSSGKLEPGGGRGDASR
ncbi:MAG: glycyl-radical enzyme activating protein [Oscillospiraceae bacterium]|jgi:pyruvate formate lyase activating enzyme|nr:glycyl-radical enzyme activating protein [Oscillospiraceae bacterium]